jgi:hypothetical protein
MKLSQSFLSPVLLLLLGSIGDAQNVGTSDFEAVLAEQPDFSEFKAILDSRQQEKNLMLQGIAQNSDSGQSIRTSERSKRCALNRFVIQ